MKYSTSNIILHVKNVDSEYKSNLCEKAKADTRTLNSRRGNGIHLQRTEMDVFTLETDHCSEKGYPFDNSRQIGNTS